MTEVRIITARFKGFCSQCHYTIWRGEKIAWNGRARHVDCLASLKDETNRLLDPYWFKILGRVKKRRVIALLEAAAEGIPLPRNGGSDSNTPRVVVQVRSTPKARARWHNSL